MVYIQDEVNEKVVSLCITGGKISARILKSAIVKMLIKMEQERDEKHRAEIHGQKKEMVAYRGKQSMKKLKQQNCELSNIEITEGNIKSFEKFARRYMVDYSLKKNGSIKPSRYYVFFKAKDVDSMTAAFKEYTGWQMNKKKKVSIHKKLSIAKKRAAKHRQRTKSKEKERETAI